MLTLTIAAVDRSSLVEAQSLRITNILTNKQDTCDFLIRKFGSRSFAPSVGQEVVITQDGTTIFGGHILQVDEQYDKLDIIGFRVRCADYTKHLDQRLVIDTYENMTAADIIADIRFRYMPSDIDISNCIVDTVITYIAFNYEYPSDCLRQLAEICGADWYIDYDKKLYFYHQNEKIAPFNLTDTAGNYIYETLRIRRDLSQLRNVVYVRGGEFLGNMFTAAYVAEQNQKHYLLPYKMADVSVTVTGQTKSLGVDPIDNETSYDALHNFQEKMVKFREDKKPTSGSAVRISGRPYLPVITKVRDPASMATFTGREYAVIDKSIQTKEAARQRALAEILAYKTTISEAQFNTYSAGLRSGQRINVQSTLRGLDEDYIINRVDMTVFATDASDRSTQLVYTVNMITTRTYDYINLLQKLLNQKKKEIVISDSEILDTVEAFEEELVLTEVVASALVHNPISESLSITDSVSSNKNYGTIFVLGPQAPSGTSRQFVFDGSRLG